jgi:hypothetical protein
MKCEPKGETQGGGPTFSLAENSSRASRFACGRRCRGHSSVSLSANPSFSSFFGVFHLHISHQKLAQGNQTQKSHAAEHSLACFMQVS